MVETSRRWRLWAERIKNGDGGKSVIIWIDAGVYNTYLADVGEADVSEIMEKALKMYFGKAV